MDDLIAMFNDHPDEGKDEDDSSQHAEAPRPKRETKKSRGAQIAVDERVGGIHMINRKVSSSQLEEYMDEYAFHTAAQLGFYTHETLNTTVLLDSVDTSTTPLAGNTRIFTVGIVMHHSGSRLTASTGQAFAKLDLGTLRTGPTISVLLFGTAYRVHAQSITSGAVIGLLQPRLLPPKSGDRITFSANDSNQIIVIAKARDFGHCQGSCRGKNERGMWVADAKPCRNIVDTSISRFCKEHQKAAMKKKVKNAFEELRDQHSISKQQVHLSKENGSGRMMTLPKTMNVIRGQAAATNNSLLNPKIANRRTEAVQVTPTARFDGSVMVPQPAAFFGRCSVIPSNNTTMLCRPRDRKPNEILANQRQVAEQTAKMKLTSKPKNRRVVTPQNAFAAAFGPTLDMEEAAVRNAQSQFANQANAEEYARSCQVLTELEKLESKKRPKTETKRLVQVWHCRTCQREFRKEPTGCYRRNHKIKLERNLRKDDSISDKRQKRTHADSQDGGLVLGQGLDWSIGNRFLH